MAIIFYVIVFIIFLSVLVAIAPYLAVAFSIASILYFIYYVFLKNRIVSKEYYQNHRTLESIKESLIEKEKYKEGLQHEIGKLKSVQENNIKEHEEKLASYNREISEAEAILSEIDSDAAYTETSVEIIDNKTASELKSDLALIKTKEKSLLKKSGIKFTVINNLTKQKKNNHSKQLLRLFNSESDSFISNITARNVDSQRNKIVRSFEQLNNLFKSDGVELTKDFLELKLEKLDLTYSYKLMAEKEKELLKAQKEEIREQQRAEQELASKKQQVEKEFKQFNGELRKMFEYMSKSTSDVERNIYADKIKDLEKQIKELEVIKEDIEFRQTNTRAGFVYVISNMGSFGENVVKIGMTRRLEPMDRINELSSASVPFKFDVHAMIFSEDAPSLENKLHKHFKDYEVNKVNTRKEFFNVKLEDIEKFILENVNQTVKFNNTIEAEEYYETLQIEKAL